MALEDILAAIRQDANAEISAVKREAKKERKAILEGARQAAARVVAEIEDTSAERISAKHQRAERDADRKIDVMRRTWQREQLAILFDELEGRLAALRASPRRYRELMRRLLAQALAVLPDAKTVRIDPRDEGLVRELVDGLSVDASLESWGGVLLDAGDGRRVDNTLEARLRSGRMDLLALIAREDSALGGRT